METRVRRNEAGEKNLHNGLENENNYHGVEWSKLNLGLTHTFT